jgi:hypothetical protein
MRFTIIVLVENYWNPPASSPAGFCLSKAGLRPRPRGVYMRAEPDSRAVVQGGLAAIKQGTANSRDEFRRQSPLRRPY